MSDVTDIEYVQVTVADLDEVEDLLATEFYPREIKRKCFGENATTPRTGMQSKNVRHCLASGVSVAARDKSTGSLVGVMASCIITRDSIMKKLNEEPKYSSEVERKTLEFLTRVNALFDPFKDPAVDSVLELFCLCVHTDYCKRGIARTMVEMSMAVAAKKGYQLARTEVSSPYSEKIFLRLGFQIKAALDFPKQDMLLDSSLLGYTSEKIMIKRM